ncbi:MAG TPA: AraC family transcriptional regulator [Flavitalea sp.]|nr:AraC family transcriptional regulator [Flavitalea sp.]
MPYDLIPVLRGLIKALQPVAASEGVELRFQAKKPSLLVSLEPDILIMPFVSLLGKLLKYLSKNEQLHIELDVTSLEYLLWIYYTGSDLSRVVDIYNHISSPVVINSVKGRNSFLIKFPVVADEAPVEQAVQKHLPVKIPLYYAEIRKRLTTYFTRSENLVNSLAQYNVRDAIFLKKINTLVMENMDNPQFDANYLSHAMNMSRTQLFRKLKPIIRQSPGNYIKSLKLQKAKELFETTDLRVGEVAFRTGFETPANFTRAFTRQFGFRPSLLCKRKEATNR